ncbi:patatin-like phospholipase family protein [uncultured Brachyspira sp.]|uniref:patatin-like phospholipase family protein n=1 Tax=uncultured Brachyspira sp. TaxID=221953 RepID=UPI0026070B8E|nr:patatin-like phospholipase family protein [uncultured Brachyspira sp.]
MNKNNSNRKIGLVLDGGGAKGAYHIGVFKALKELDIIQYINTISGASVGALNACLFSIYNLNSKIAENIWLNEVEDKILTLNYNNVINSLFEIRKNYIKNAVNEIISDFLNDDNILFIPFINFLSTSAIFSRDGIMEIMDKYLYEETIKKMNIYVSCTNIDNLKPYYFKLNNYSLKTIKKILLASSAIPAVFPPENIEGILYIDGGISDNSPIRALKNNKFTDIIVVHLKRNSNSNILKNKLDNNLNVYELYPQKNLGNFFEGTLNFSSNFIKKCMHQGYIDALTLLK